MGTVSITNGLLCCSTSAAEVVVTAVVIAAGTAAGSAMVAAGRGQRTSLCVRRPGVPFRAQSHQRVHFIFASSLAVLVQLTCVDLISAAGACYDLMYPVVLYALLRYDRGGARPRDRDWDRDRERERDR